MENRAATIGARLTFTTSSDGTLIVLDIPLERNGGPP
jgi:signal transduction histidine kinase